MTALTTYKNFSVLDNDDPSGAAGNAFQDNWKLVADHIASTSDPHSTGNSKVGIDAGATPGYLGAAGSDGVLRVADPLTYTDGGDYATLGIDESKLDHDQLLNFTADEHFTVGSIDHTAIQNVGSNTHAQIDTHIGSTSNPHSVTYSQVGADAAGTAAAEVASHESTYDHGSYNSHLTNTSNPHSVTYTQVGADASGTAAAAVASHESTYNHSNYDSHLSDTANPHSVTYAQAGAIQDAADAVKDTHIDWGTGASQVSAADVPIADAGGIIAGEEVETALAENRTAIDLNTTHRTSDGSDHSFLDQSVVSGSSPVFSNANMTGDISVWTNDSGYITATLTQEQVEDYAGNLVSNATGTHTGITITYQDGSNDVDFVVDHDTAQNYVADEHIDWTNASDNFLTTGTLDCGGPLTITQNSDTVVVSHDGTNPYVKWSDGYLTLQTDEGTSANTILAVYGKGSGTAQIFLYDANDTVYMSLQGRSGRGDIKTAGTGAGDVVVQSPAHADVKLFEDATSGETRALEICGYRSGDSLRTFSVSVGASAADQVDLSGLTTYSFAGTVTATTLTDGTFSVTGGAVTGATGNISMWTNDHGYYDSDDDVDHDATTNFVADEHVAHSGVTLTAGEGLSGGGDISTSRSFALDFTELDADTIAADDLLCFYDDTGTHHNKITFANFEGTLNHDSLSGFVSQEHIDWTNASDNFSTTGTLGCGGPLTITQNSDTVVWSHDGTDAYCQWSDGSLILKTDEGTDTNTIVKVHGKGTGDGKLYLYEENDTEYLELLSSGVAGYVRVKGSSPGKLLLQDPAHDDIRCFSSCAEGETPSFRVRGFRSGDSARELDICVGASAADQIDFTGLSTYSFDGDVVVADATPSLTLYDTDISGANWGKAKITGSSNLLLLGHAKVDGSGAITFWTMDATDGSSATSYAVTVDDLTISTPSNIYNLSHDSFADFDANEHVDHTGVTLTAGDGLTGGGDISSDRTFALSHLGIESLADPGADRIIFWDDGESACKWLQATKGVQISGTELTFDYSSLTADTPADADLLCFYDDTGSAHDKVTFLNFKKKFAADAVIALYTSNQAQSIPNAAFTIVDWEDQVHDTDSCVTTGASWKFTASTPGYYHVSFCNLFDTTTTWATTEIAQWNVYKNGAQSHMICRETDHSSADNYMECQGSFIIYLNGTTDYFDIRVYQNSGAALTFYNNGDFNFIAIHLVR